MRFDPRAAAATLIILAIALALSPNWLLGGWMLAITATGLFQRSFGHWWLKLRSFGWMIVCAAGSATLFGSLNEGIILAGRLILFAGISALGARWIDPLAFGDALICGGMRPQFVFLIEGIIRFAPLMRHTITTTINAQRCRGIPLEGWNLLRRAPAFVVPVIFQTLEHANLLAETLEARGFSSPHWTPLNTYRWRWHDWLVCGCGLGILGIMWGLR